METQELLKEMDSKLKSKLAEIQEEREQIVKDSKKHGEKLDGVTEKIDKHLEQFEKYVKENSLTLEQATKAFEEFKGGEFSELKEKYEEAQKHVDELDRKLQKQGSKSAASKLNLKGALNDYFKNDENLQVFTAMKNRKAKTHSIDLNVPLVHKVVGDMTTGNYDVTDGDVITPLHLAGVYRDPVRTVHIRELLNVATTSSPFIEFVKEVGGEGDVGPQHGEGTEKDQVDFDLKASRVNVETLAAYVRMSQQMLDDTDFLRTYITTRLTEKMMLHEDVQLLTGNGQTENLTGLIPNATAFNHGAFWQSDQDAGKYDALVAAIDQATIAEYSPTGILLHPTDYHKLILEKGDDGHYRFPMTVLNGEQPRVGGVPLFKSTAMTVGDFLVADFMKGATLFDRQSISIQFSTEDGSNFIKNQVTVRIEERLALAIFLEKAFVTGDFTEVVAGFKST